ncbi:MAG: ThuA domain-containing protein [Alphaproteobacteria bacterium]
MADEEVPDYHDTSSRATPTGATYWQDDKKKVLLVTRGHPFARDPFYQIFEANDHIEYSAVEHPAAQYMFNPDFAKNFDCYVMYDMPGIQFNPGGPPSFIDPPQFYKDGVMAMLEEGFPLVIMHHTCAAWPAWPEWSEIVGSHFLYKPMKSRGVDKPDSGYIIDVPHTVSPVMDHPITAGIEPFELVDEVYLAEVFEDSVTPLFTSNYEFTKENFYSADLALKGQMNSNEGWEHDPGSNMVGWIKTYKNSPIVYLQFGDGPATYGNPVFRKILQQAIDWACSDEAKAWAREQAKQAAE